MRSAIEYNCRKGCHCSTLETLNHYLLLAKPRVVLLVVVTTVAGMVLEGSLLSVPLVFLTNVMGVILAAGAAGALNQYYDRDIDAVMRRTRARRPIPAGKIGPQNALRFGVTIGIAGLVLLALAGNGLTAVLALGSIIWYIAVYTRWLKRRTPLNIVIGGAAGGVGPLIGWAAGAGALSMEAWLMFLVIFLWTPVHFWAQALYTRDQYAEAGVPMLPVTCGEKRTFLHISFYAGLLVPATACLGMVAGLNRLFFLGTVLLAINLIRKVALLWYNKGAAPAQELFRYSNIYLAVLFVLVLISKW